MKPSGVFPVINNFFFILFIAGLGKMDYRGISLFRKTADLHSAKSGA